MTPDEFWTRVDRSGGPEACWPWLGGHRGDGYGGLRWNGRMERAHRVALALDGRPVEAGLVARHLCHNPICCNPAHLAAGTAAENNEDARRAGRASFARRLTAEQAHCLRAWYRRGLATSSELAGLFGLVGSRVRHIATDEPYREDGRMSGLNGSGRKVCEAAAGLGKGLGDVGQAERVVAGFYLALVARPGSRRLIVGHRERRPSAEEALEIAKAAGAPVGSEPSPGRVFVTHQDIPWKRVDTMEFAWRIAE